MSLEQVFSAVLDPMRSKETSSWSMKSLFNRELRAVCPLAAATTVNVDMPNSGHTISPVANSQNNLNYHYQLTKASMPFDLAVAWDSWSPNLANPMASKISTHRFLGGVGDASGTIHVHFYNRNEHEIALTYFESIPWILKPYIHTLRINGKRDSGGLVII